MCLAKTCELWLTTAVLSSDASQHFCSTLTPGPAAVPPLSHLTGVPESRAVASQSCNPQLWSKLHPSSLLFSMSYNTYMTLISQDLLSSGTKPQDICPECLLDHINSPISLFGSTHTYRRENWNSLCSITHEQLQLRFQTRPMKGPGTPETVCFAVKYNPYFNYGKMWRDSTLGWRCKLCVKSLLNFKVCLAAGALWGNSWLWCFQLKYSHLGMVHCAENE